jgi:Transglycosylase-like domain
MQRLLVLLACCTALAALPSLAAAKAPTGGAAPAAEPGSGTATTAQIPRRVRVAYLRWRSRLERHHVYVGRTLLPQVRAADGTTRPPTAAELRDSLHRMQRRWGRWLRTTDRGEAVRFKLKVNRKVPVWGKQYLRAIAACESHGNPRAVGGGGAYRGMYQFSVSTWYVVGGTGDPAAASRWEQTWRAWLVLSRHGSGHWPNCG